MTEIVTYVERIEIVLNKSASIKVIQLNEALEIDGVVRQITPVAASSVTDARVMAILDSVSQTVTAERNEAVAALETQRVAMQAEIDRLTALVPAPVSDYMITPSVLVERLETASPGVIDRLWSSDTKEAGRLAVTLFTWSERIDCRPGGRLEGYLNLIVQIGFMAAEDVSKVWVV